MCKPVQDVPLLAALSGLARIGHQVAEQDIKFVHLVARDSLIGYIAIKEITCFRKAASLIHPPMGGFMAGFDVAGYRQEGGTLQAVPPSGQVH